MGSRILTCGKNVIVGVKPYGYGTPCAQDITYEDNKVNPAPPPSMSVPRDSNGRPGKAHFNAPERIGKDADQVGYWGFPVAEEEPDYVKLARAKAGLEASFRSGAPGAGIVNVHPGSAVRSARHGLRSRGIGPLDPTPAAGHAEDENRRRGNARGENVHGRWLETGRAAGRK